MRSPATARLRRVRPEGDDSGSGTVWVLAVTALVACVAAALVLMVELRATRAQAATAADLAALAAAGRLPDPQRACDIAEQVAQAQAAHLVSCSTHGLVVEVVVSVPLVGPLAAFPDLTVRSRAGPPGAP